MFKLIAILVTIAAIVLTFIFVLKPNDPPIVEPTTTITTIAPTEAPTTTEAPVTQAPKVIAIDRDEIMLLFAGTEKEVTQNSIQTASPGSTSPPDRTYTGVALMEILKLNGVSLGDLTEAATLTIHGGGAKPGSVSYDYALFTADTSLIAWYENGSDVCRSCVLDGAAALFMKDVFQLILNYNA